MRKTSAEMFSRAGRLIGGVFVVVVGAGAVAGIVRAFTGPTASPPQGSSAISVSGSNVGIGTGTSTPISPLTVGIASYGDGTLEVVNTIGIGGAPNLNPGTNRWSLRVGNIGPGEGKFDIYDARNSLSRFLIDSSGNVGIGTTTPSAKLEVNGNAVIDGTISGTNTGTLSAGNISAGTFGSNTGGGNYTFPNNVTLTGNTIYFSGATGSVNTTGGPLIYGDGNNTVVKIGSGGGGLIVQNYSGSNTDLLATSGNSYINGGNLGIGTASPASKLEISSAATTLANVQATISNNAVAVSAAYGSGSNYIPGLVWYTTDNNSTKPKAGVWEYQDGSGSKLYFGTSNAYSTGITNTALVINPAGNVGVGTTGPGYRLDVQGGQINSSGGYCINGANCITSWPSSSGGTVTSVTAGSGLSGGTITSAGTISLNTANANTWSAAQTFTTNIIPGMASNSGGSVWNFGSGAWSGNGPAVTNTDAVTGMTYAGGSGSQLYTLSSVPGQASFQLDGSMFVGDNGSPYNPLSITGASDGYLLVDNSASVGGNLYVSGSINGAISAANVSAGTFGSNTGSGNYTFPGAITMYGTGVGQINLNSAGTYYGNISNPSSQVWALGYGSGGTTVGTPVLAWNASGNVGIGTTGPGQTLTVNGTAGVTGELYVNNNGTGTGSGSTGSIQLGDGTFSKTYGSSFTLNSQLSALGYCINGANCITSWPTGNAGTVTSVTAGSGLSGGTITSAGTISLNTANANTWSAAQTFNGGASANALTVGSSGYTNQAGDIGVSRNASPSTGVIYLGSGGSHYLYFDGTNYNLASGGLTVGGTITGGNYLYLNSGNAVQATDSYLRLNQSGNFSGGVYTPGQLRTDGGLVSGAVSGNGGGTITASGNMYFTGANPYIYSGSSYIVIPNGLYVSGGTPYFQTQIQARGGIHNDNSSQLVLSGGTSAQTYVSGSAGGVTDYGPLATGDSSGNGLSFGYDTTNNWGWIYARTTGCCGRPVNIASSLYVNGGSGKITAGTIDPIYTIDGTNYATYETGMTGVKEQTAGTLDLTKGSDGAYATTIDFGSAAKGSDFWLFSQATDLKDHLSSLIVSLTPSFDGRVWYTKDVADEAITIHAVPTAGGDGAAPSVEVSYTFIAPRFDAAKWSNLAPADESAAKGFIINTQE